MQLTSQQISKDISSMIDIWRQAANENVTTNYPGVSVFMNEARKEADAGNLASVYHHLGTVSEAMRLVKKDTGFFNAQSNYFLSNIQRDVASLMKPIQSKPDPI